MSYTQQFSALKACVETMDVSCFEQQLNILVEHESIENASELIGLIFLTEFSHDKTDDFIIIMKIVCSKQPELALTGLTENPLLKAIVIKGSKSLFNVYMTEVIEPIIEKKEKSERLILYTELYQTIKILSVGLFNDFQLCLKGIDYLEPIPLVEFKVETGLISMEHFDLMDVTIEDYNGILGRRDILVALNKQLVKER